MRFVVLYILLIISFRPGFSQALDTIEVSNNMTTYLLLASDVLEKQIGNGDYVAIFKDNMVSLKATKANGTITTLMVRTKTSVNVWILKFSFSPKSIMINKGNPPPAIQQQTVTSQNNSQQQNIPQKQREDNVQASAGKPVVATVAPSSQGGYISPEMYSKRNEDKYGKEVQPDKIKERAETGNRNVNIQNEMMQKKFYRMSRERKRIKDIGEISSRIYFALEDIFVDREFMYFKIAINNTSSIAFDLDFISFEMGQGKTFKRKEAVSQMYLQTDHYETVYTVAPMTEESLIYAVKIFAQQDNDFILVKLSELGGVRTTEFKIPAKLISTAKSL
jgi:hypothetical protein